MSTPQAPREPTPERVAEAALNIATRRTEEHMEFQRQRDAMARALRNLSIGYVALLEAAHRRIIDAGGTCDSVARMEAGDPYLREARAVLATAK